MENENYLEELVLEITRLLDGVSDSESDSAEKLAKDFSESEVGPVDGSLEELRAKRKHLENVLKENSVEDDYRDVVEDEISLRFLEDDEIGRENLRLNRLVEQLGFVELEVGRDYDSALIETNAGRYFTGVVSEGRCGTDDFIEGNEYRCCSIPKFGAYAMERDDGRWVVVDKGFCEIMSDES